MFFLLLLSTTFIFIISKTNEIKLFKKLLCYMDRVRLENNKNTIYKRSSFRQRDLLMKFFYPQSFSNYTPDCDVTSDVTKPTFRKTPHMNLSINFLHESDMDVLFMKDEKIKKLNINAQKVKSNFLLS